MTCRACEEARRAALAIYDRMAAEIRKRQTTPPFFKLRGPSNTREPYTKAEIDAIRKRASRQGR